LQPCRILAIAPLAQCDYKKNSCKKKHVTAIATKKQLQKTQVKKVQVQKNQFKKNSMP
jgi:hypothetical protein